MPGLSSPQSTPSNQFLAAFKGPVEFARHFCQRELITDVLFDADGTLSLIRAGWPEVMVPLFLEHLPVDPSNADESLNDRRSLASYWIDKLTGQNTIFQMAKLAELITERGGNPDEPSAYKAEYLRRLEARIAPIKEGLASGLMKPEEYTVAGSRIFLDGLKSAGLRLWLASGTDEAPLKEELELLGLAHYFEGRVFGANDANKKSGKREVIREVIIHDHGVPGMCLLGIGDGIVEARETVAAGGQFLALATEETQNPTGVLDPPKLARLLEVGAELAVPNFLDQPALMAALFRSRQ